MESGKELKLSDYFHVDIENYQFDGSKHVSLDCRKKDDNTPCNISVSVIYDKFGDEIVLMDQMMPEMDGREGNIDFILANQAIYEAEFKSLLDNIEAKLIEAGVIEQKDLLDDYSKKPSLRESLDKIKSAAADYDIPTAEKVLRSLKEMSWTAEEQAIIDRVDSLIQNVDFEALQEI